jgi:hypothetical protein
MLADVIVVSCARDLPVNRISIPAVIEYIPAARYVVVVPKPDCSAFQKALPGQVTVISEESLLSGWNLGQIAAKLPQSVRLRAGWYYQQLLKIEAVRQLPGNSEALVWDGDTVPLRPLKFKDSAGRVGFYVGQENHAPYFDTTRRLLNRGRAISHSFIAQCMYLRARWIWALIETIERNANAEWVDAVLSCVTGKCQSEFSEYETIGTFVASEYSLDFFINPRPWYRWGMAYFGGIDQVTRAGLIGLSKSYDYVAFETWDRGLAATVRARRQRLADRMRSWREKPGFESMDSHGNGKQ